MNLKRVIDIRSGEDQIDKKALSLAIACGLVLYWTVRALVPGDWHFAVIAALVVIGIFVEVWMARRHSETPREEQ